DAGGLEEVLVVGHDERSAREGNADEIVRVGAGDAEGGGDELVLAADRLPLLVAELDEGARRVGGRGERRAEAVDVGALPGDDRGLDLGQLVVGRGKGLPRYRRAGLGLELRRRRVEPGLLLGRELSVVADVDVEGLPG